VVFFVWMVLSHLGAGRGDLQAAFANPLVAAAALLAIVSIAWHMRLGMQVVIEDYVESEGAKVILVALNHFFAFAVAAVSIVSVLMLALGG
jgi:succinate dehydrogenase / fumarate reductase membrane anchor subunit